MSARTGLQHTETLFFGCLAVVVPAVRREGIDRTAPAVGGVDEDEVVDAVNVQVKGKASARALPVVGVRAHRESAKSSAADVVV